MKPAVKKKNYKYIAIFAVILLLMFAFTFQSQLFGTHGFFEPGTGETYTPPDTTPETPYEPDRGEPTICGIFRGSGSLPPRDTETKVYTGSCDCDFFYLTIEKSISFPGGQITYCEGYSIMSLIVDGVPIWSETDTSSINTYGDGEMVTGYGGCYLSMTVDNHFGCSIDYTFVVTVYGYPT